MKNILIISNCAASETESNGRIHLLHYKKYLEEEHIFNFYLTGSPDCKKINYLSFINRDVLKTKIFKSKNCFPKTFKGGKHVNNVRKKRKHPFLSYFLRNWIYKNNNAIIDSLNNVIEKHKIDVIVLWGCNVPFLYDYALKIALKNNIKVITYTGEDYPLKNYNYFTKKPSIFFRSFQKELFNNCLRLYRSSYCNIYASNDLKAAYEDAFSISGGVVVYFSSELKHYSGSVKQCRNIVYAGNLYKDRVKSLVEISNYISKYESTKIHIYGQASNTILKIINKHENFIYHGCLPYEKLVNELICYDLLLHIEGFSDYYKKDCKFAFSTKIADYFMLNKPVFMYGPIDISGIKFAYELNKAYVATSKDELSKLDNVFNNLKSYAIDLKKIDNFFEASTNCERIAAIIEK